MTMTESKPRPLTSLQMLKFLVMINSLVLLFILFLAFFNLHESHNTEFEQSKDVTNISFSSPATATAGVDKELANLPYVSATGLQQQAVAQVISYQQQPVVRARSSR